MVKFKMIFFPFFRVHKLSREDGHMAPPVDWLHLWGRMPSWWEQFQQGSLAKKIPQCQDLQPLIGASHNNCNVTCEVLGAVIPPMADQSSGHAIKIALFSTGQKIWLMSWRPTAMRQTGETGWQGQKQLWQHHVSTRTEEGGSCVTQERIFSR